MAVIAKRKAGGKRITQMLAGLKLSLGLRGRHQASSPPLFIPNMMSGLLYWYDAADTTSFTLSGSQVTQINDKSGNNLFMTQPSSGNQPLYNNTFLSPNGKCGFVISGARFIANEAVSFPASDVTSFCAGMLRTTAPSGARAFTWSRAGLAESGANGTVIHFRSSTGTVLTVLGGGGTAAQSAFIYDQWFVHSAVRLAAEVRSAIDGGADNINTTGVTAYLGPITRVAIGCALPAGAAIGSNAWLGPIGEVFGYNRLLGAAEYAMCQGYAAWKWGTQALLPGGHTWALRAPTVADFLALLA